MSRERVGDRVGGNVENLSTVSLVLGCVSLSN